MINIQIRNKERAALKLLKPAVEQALYESDVDLEVPSEHTGVTGFYDHNLKINKAVYAAIERFDLPLVRTWYRYGQYEPYDALRPKNIDVGPNADRAYVPSGLRTDVSQEDITDYLLSRGLKSDFEQNLFEFLSSNYSEWNPEPFTHAYLANTQILREIERIYTADREELLTSVPSIQEEIQQASIDLRYELSSINAFDQSTVDHFETFFTGLNRALLKIDETSEITDEQWELLNRSRVIYHEYSWPWAALQISMRKAQGPSDRQEEFVQSGSDLLSQEVGSYKTMMKGWEAELSERKLSSVRAVNSSATPKPPEAIKQLQNATIDLSDGS